MSSKEKLTFKNLILDELELAKSNRDAELGAILMGALYQNDTLLKIVDTKMTAICPNIASEAFTMANELAENVERIRNEESNKAATESSGSAGPHTQI